MLVLNLDEPQRKVNSGLDEPQRKVISDLDEPQRKVISDLDEPQRKVICDLHKPQRKLTGNLIESQRKEIGNFVEVQRLITDFGFNESGFVCFSTYVNFSIGGEQRLTVFLFASNLSAQQFPRLHRQL